MPDEGTPIIPPEQPVDPNQDEPIGAGTDPTGGSTPPQPEGEAPVTEATTGTPATTGAIAHRTPDTAEVSDDDRLMTALAWISMAILQIPLVSVVLLLAEGNKDRPFQRYHAITSILFWVAAVGYEVLAAIVFTLLSLVSFGCLAFCLWVIFFVPHLAALWYTVQAYQGRYSEIPIISELARSQHWV